MPSEADWEHKLYALLDENTRNYLFHGVKLNVRAQYDIDGKKADLVVLEGGAPILVIETKRKGDARKSLLSKTDPYSKAVIGQALCYSVMIASKLNMPKTPMFATTNPDRFVVFKPIDMEEAKDIVDIDQCKRGNYEKAIREDRFSDIRQNYIFNYYERIDKDIFKGLLENVVKIVKENNLEGQKETFTLILDQLRYFVDFMNKNFVRDKLKILLLQNNDFRSLLNRLAKESGYEEGLDHLIGKNLENIDKLSKMMVYVLLNKIIFYKILSNVYSLPELKPIYESESKSCPIGNQQIRNVEDYLECLNSYFNEAEKVTRDYEAIFDTGLFDNIKISDEEEAMKELDDIISLISGIDHKVFADVIGHVYQDLIEPSERHALGQFYTPPLIARLIANWAIRNPNDKVLDPGCGSGTFLIKSYERLVELKTGKRQGYPPADVHKKVLDQLYGIDTNTFAVHLASMNLSVKDPYSPSTNVNVVRRDYFEIIPNQKILTPYRVSTPRGEEKREVVFVKDFDAVIGNPPYTRWTELNRQTRDIIKDRLHNLLKQYELTPNVRAGKEIPIYIYWIMHSTNFLKEGGRLGMIISNLWLHTNYGVQFGNFLLDHYRIKVLIDFSMRLFDALISTVILLAEKESDKGKRENNTVTLIRIPPEIQDVEGVLNCVESSFNSDGSLNKDKLEGCKKKYRIYYRTISQSEIPRDEKWIGLLFDADKIIKKLTSSKNIVRLEEYFTPSRGNSIWSIWALHSGKRPDLGAKDFFYFSESKAEQWFSGNMDCLVPAITSSREIRTFKFTKEDWEELKKKDMDAFLFVCHRERVNLPNDVEKYIRWGESDKCKTQIRSTRTGGEEKNCNEAEACKAREKIGKPMFYGWYDLGGYVPTPIMTIYQFRYHPQFFLCEIPLVTYHSVITLIPKMPVKTSKLTYDPEKDFIEKIPKQRWKNIQIRLDLSLDEKDVKALLAFMSSTVIWIWLELKARYIPKGPLGLEANILKEMPLLDVKKIDREYVEELAELFDQLEEKARHSKGSTKESMFTELRPIYREIDLKINEILSLEEDVDKLWEIANEMMKRRIVGSRDISRPGDVSLRSTENFETESEEEEL